MLLFARLHIFGHAVYCINIANVVIYLYFYYYYIF